VSPSDKALRVMLADHDNFFREGLRGMLEGNGVAVVGEAADGVEAIALAHRLAPDIVVIDPDMPGVSGGDALRQIAAVGPDTRVVVLTLSASESDVLEALSAGARGYILKSTSAEDVIGGIRSAASDHAVLSQQVMLGLLKRMNSKRSPAARQPASVGPALTPRELQVLRLIVGGADNAAIGRKLSISPHTVKRYVTNIFEKLGVRTRVEAAVYAVRAGLA
jgi:DNA-binding NarL/FixJ family response regulator